jgi:predicted short-subunit dehydrogenase-like oxidoreductase (DUF2520 family)
VLLGAGNVATHLYGALSQVCNVVQVWSRNIAHAERLIADSRISHPVSNLTDIVTDADYYIISVPDNAISDVANHLPQVTGVVAHTSGSVGMQVLCNANAYGVFYPLQTFSREKKVNIAETPFFIEGCNEATTAKLECLARTISTTVLCADSQQRASLHIAAVFACNFANHLWSIATDILHTSGYEFDVFRPLLRETLDKAFEIGAKQAQTGPARRGDTNVINAHLAKLDGDKHKLYELVTKMIISQHHEQNKF